MESRLDRAHGWIAALSVVLFCAVLAVVILGIERPHDRVQLLCEVSGYDNTRRHSGQMYCVRFRTDDLAYKETPIWEVVNALHYE